MKNKIFLFFVLSARIVSAQLPETDIWLFSLKNEKENCSVEKGLNITSRTGYDNQPCFSADSKKIYYTSIREDKQADIYVYAIGDKKSIQLTKTPESEYSPTLTPDKKKLAGVAVLKDSSQVIVTVSLKDGMYMDYVEGKLEVPQLNSFDSVGYFTFLNADTVIYYKLTQPHSLLVRSISSQKDVWLANNPVRGFKMINRHEFIYGLKDSAKVTFYRYNTLVRKATYYCDYNSLGEDIVWHEKWGLLKSEGVSILKFDEKENKWQILFDLSKFGLKKITRFTFDPKNKKLAVVDNN